jgi:hypothetical protein
VLTNPEKQRLEKQHPPAAAAVSESGWRRADKHPEGEAEQHDVQKRSHEETVRRFPKGRTWDRNRREGDRLEATWANLLLSLQELFVDAEGRPISLSATGFHSALGQIRDLLAGSDELRRIAALIVRELADR